MQTKEKNNLTSSKFDSKRKAKNELTLSEILIGQSCSTHYQESDGGLFRILERRERKRKELSREMVVLFKMKPE